MHACFFMCMNTALNIFINIMMLHATLLKQLQCDNLTLRMQGRLEGGWSYVFRSDSIFCNNHHAPTHGHHMAITWPSHRHMAITCMTYK